MLSDDEDVKSVSSLLSFFANTPLMKLNGVFVEFIKRFFAFKFSAQSILISSFHFHPLAEKSERFNVELCG